ncbi:MAG: hypothetical protein HON70_31720, partial [Lentisphaerae bacterium]|nr:hypothetical protein [Lentisphaerota bacterium]
MTSGDIARRIEQFLDGEDQTLTPGLRRLVRDYEGQREVADQRLRSCCELLDTAQPDEAVDIASEDPPLLDMAKALQLERSDEWKEICELYELPVAVPPDLSLVERVRKACSEINVVEPLLKRYRALAQSGSTKEKMSLLRRLVVADPKNGRHRKQLSALEVVRHGDIKTEAKTAILGHDRESLQAIQDELNLPSWVRPPEEKVAQKIAETLRQWHSEELSVRAGELIVELQDACEADSVDRTIRLLDLWDDLATTPDFRPNAEWATIVDPIREWKNGELLRRSWEERCGILLRNLTHALENRNLYDGEKLWFKLEQEGYSVPDLHGRKLRGLREEVELERGRRIRFIALAVTVLVALAGALGYVLVRNMMRNRVCDEVVASVQTKLVEKELDLARSIVDSRLTEHSFLATRQEFVEISQRLGEREDEETTREACFEKMYKELSDQRQEGFPLSGTTEALLARAREVARSNEEVYQLDDLETALKTTRAEQQQGEDEQFLEAVNSLDNLFAELKRLDAYSEAEKYDRQLADAIIKFGKLKTWGGVTRELPKVPLERLEPTLQRAKARQAEGHRKLQLDREETEARRVRLQPLLEQLTHGPKTLKDYLQLLKKLVHDYPERTRENQGFLPVLKQADMYRDADLLADYFGEPDCPVPFMKPSIWDDSLPACAQYGSKLVAAAEEVAMAVAAIRNSEFLAKEVHRYRLALRWKANHALSRVMILNDRPTVADDPATKEHIISGFPLVDQFGKSASRSLYLTLNSRNELTSAHGDPSMPDTKPETPTEYLDPKTGWQRFLHHKLLHDLPDAKLIQAWCPPAYERWQSPETAFADHAQKARDFTPFAVRLKLLCMRSLLEIARTVAPPGKGTEAYDDILGRLAEFEKGQKAHGERGRLDWVLVECNRSWWRENEELLNSLPPLTHETLKLETRAADMTLKVMTIRRRIRYIGFVDEDRRTPVLADSAPKTGEIWIVTRNERSG